MKNVFYLIILCSFSLCAMKRRELSNKIVANLNRSIKELEIATNKDAQFKLDPSPVNSYKKTKQGCLLTFMGNLPFRLTNKIGEHPLRFEHLYQGNKTIKPTLIQNLKKEFTISLIEEMPAQFGTAYTYLILPKSD